MKPLEQFIKEYNSFDDDFKNDVTLYEYISDKVKGEREFNITLKDYSNDLSEILADYDDEEIAEFKSWEELLIDYYENEFDLVVESVTFI